MSLISAAELRARLDDPALRLADVRWWLADPAKGRLDYEAGHIPGAVFVDVDTDLVGREGPGRHPLPDPAVFAARMSALGFGDEHEIVAYDDAGGTIAARLWWMLDDLGHSRVRVLDGGIGAWEAAGGPLSREVRTHPPAAMTLASAWKHRIERTALVERLGTVALLDARAPERYRGDVEPIDPVAGHIPTARSAPAGGTLSASGTFIDPEALRIRFEALAAGDPVVVSCGSGITAAHLALGMRVAGLPDPLLYGGSYSDWSRARLPVVTGDAPGSVPEELRKS
jgi:thiosulfate/3-mercaptopyruvate sulfurtransferase